MRKIVTLIKNYKLVRIILNSFLGNNGYFNQIGWTNSYDTRLPVSQNGEALPWVTYPFINFISERLNNNMQIFEFGSGNSTIFYAGRVKSVHSVEHDLEWVAQLKKMLPENAKIFHQEPIYGGEYCEYCKFPNTLDRKFDIVIIDGRDRVNCMINAVGYITENGVIVLDNSDRDSYATGIFTLLTNGYKKIDFWGLAPGFLHKTCTTIFYKAENCLNI